MASRDMREVTNEVHAVIMRHASYGSDLSWMYWQTLLALMGGEHLN